MEINDLYVVTYYDNYERGHREHNEVYTSLEAAKNRFDKLYKTMNQYSWVVLYKGIVKYGRVRRGGIIQIETNCVGGDDRYHGDEKVENDF